MYGMKDRVEPRLSENCDAARAQPQVAEQLEVQERILVILRDRVTNLEERLGAVLSDLNSASDGTGVPEQYLCPVANQIRDHNHRIGQSLDAILSILNRLEV